MQHINQNDIPYELYTIPVVIYGGAYMGRRFIDLLTSGGIKIQYIVDDNEMLQGTYIKNIKVISYEQFIEYSKKNKVTAVIITTVYAKAVYTKLKILPNIQIYELFDWYNNLLTIEKKSSSFRNNFDILEKVEVMKEKIKLLENEWEDEESIRVLNGLMNYIDSKDLDYLFDVCEEDDHYFILEVRKSIKCRPMNIIDAGAYQGELLQSLKKYGLNFNKWYCFEADSTNFKNLLKQSEINGLNDGQQICFNKGLWNESGKLYFECNDLESRIVPYKTNNVIDVVSIDDCLGEVSCNYIKMDIEGAELPALKGGIELIRRERPILAISIYHSPDDFWQIPEYLMSELNNYRFYVRHHAAQFCDTVLYAIPNES